MFAIIDGQGASTRKTDDDLLQIAMRMQTPAHARKRAKDVLDPPDLKWDLLPLLECDKPPAVVAAFRAEINYLE